MREKKTSLTLLILATIAILPTRCFAGSVIAWGSNQFGQLNVPAGNDFVAISAGGSGGLALRSDGSLAAWGERLSGEPILYTPSGNDYTAIAGDGRRSLALRSDGSLAAWGKDRDLFAPSGNDFVSISGSGYWYAALRSDGFDGKLGGRR